jgi:PadR family transcriptional regulator PadR
MGKQETEMLKGTLEGVVLEALTSQATHGYEIVSWLRARGFDDIAEGTVYALLVRIEQRGLVDVERVASNKGPLRKVYSVNPQGQKYLDDFWATWDSLRQRLELVKQERRAQ